MTIEGVLTAACSTTPLEKEYRAIAAAMSRCAPTVTTFDARAYDQRTLERARRMWIARMDAEHRSTSVFMALGLQLMEANATLDAKAVVLRMAQDELRHAELCARVVEALGGVARCEVDLEVSKIAQHAGCSPQERALRNVIYGCCLSEIVNSARFVDAIDTMSDPFIRDATRQLLADEVLHGQFGFHYLEWSRPWLDEHPQARVTIGRYLRFAFAVLERDLSGASPKKAELTKLTDEERAIGIPDPERLPVVFYQTIEGAIVPGLERFGIDAGEAWRSRSLVK